MGRMMDSWVREKTPRKEKETKNENPDFDLIDDRGGRFRAVRDHSRPAEYAGTANPEGGKEEQQESQEGDCDVETGRGTQSFAVEVIFRRALLFQVRARYFFVTTHRGRR